MHIRHRVLVGIALSAILYLMFHQMNIALDSQQVSFEPTEIAYGYDGVAFSGTVYLDEGETSIGLGSGVALSINGGSAETATTNSSGEYSFSGLTINQDDIVAVYINNEVENGVLVAKFNDAELSDKSVTGMDIYTDRLILRSSTADRNITTTNLDTADNAGDADVTAVYSIVGTDLHMKNGKELYIWEDTTHTTSGSILTHDLEVKGTLTMASNADITASGSFVVMGDITTTGDTTLTSYASGEVLQVNGTSLNNLYVDYGLEAYFRFDEGVGLNATGATINSATGGSLIGLPNWVQANTGTTLFFNPYALEFDGQDDRITFGDAYDIDDNSTMRTFSTWFRRKSADTEDVIFSKKSGSGASTAGYMLWIDDTSDAVMFEVANGTNNYLVTSTTTVTDQDWHHIAVSYNPLDTAAINIFIDGTIDVSAKTGSLESSGEINGTFSNAEEFIIGRAETGSGTFHGTIDDFRIYNRAMSGSEISQLGAGNKTTGSGTYNLRSDLDINGDFCIYAGTVDVGTGHTINVAGDYCSYAGQLNTNSGSFILDGTSQTLRGSTAFNRLTKASTSIVTLTFEANTQQTISGALTIQGALSNATLLRSTRTGSQSYLALENSGATLLKYLNVRDSNGSGGSVLVCTEGCIDGSRNNNWLFLSECGDGIVGSGEQCDDGNSNNNDTCPNDCQYPVCGDDILEGLEECEPPNSGTCLSNCLERSAGGGSTNISSSSIVSYYKKEAPPEGCGNGILELEKGEECDAGTRFNGLGTCSYDCKKLICGDGIISPQIGEDCEPAVQSITDDNKVFVVASCGETCSAPESTPQGTYFGGCKRLFLQPCGVSNSSSSSLKPSAMPLCGNGTVDSGEECDFGGICTGGTFDGSSWTDAISAESCVAGGGTPEPTPGDGCSETCLSEFCGDGVVQERGADNQVDNEDDEECDNGSICSNNPSVTCRLNSDCTDGGTCEYDAALDSTCSAQCKMVEKPNESNELDNPLPTITLAVCGNGTVEITEECDDGPNNGLGSSSCTVLCTAKVASDTVTSSEQSYCGDGIVQENEDCDDGEQNSDIKPNVCRTNCRLPTCGDFVQDNNEQCDNGNGNSNILPDSCRANCMLPVCGDGIVDSNEQCDGGASCTSACWYQNISFCGDGTVDPGEQCDDGNINSLDGCNAACENEIKIVKPVACGNGIVEPGEQCDDGNKDNEDECSNECTVVQEQTQEVATNLVIDADIVIVNPEEYANGLKFSNSDNPCSLLTIKGMNEKAKSIRSAANRQGIPIVKNIDLARSLYASVNIGEKVFGDLCDAINALKPKQAAPSQPLPQAPTLNSYGYFNYAQLQPIVIAKPPVGDTGPAAMAFVITGAAGGIGWIRRRNK